jgi:hypothetical protein
MLGRCGLGIIGLLALANRRNKRNNEMEPAQALR